MFRLLSLLSSSLLAIYILAFSIHSQADTIKVAVASNFLSTAKALTTQFNTLNAEHTLKIISASTGQLSQQILNGAPFDIFLAANKQHPQVLQQQLSLPIKNLQRYALGSLVFISRKPLSSSPDTLHIKSDSLKKFLSTDSNKRIAIANAKLAPYGQASFEVLEHLELLPAIKSKLITGQNISQAFQFFQSGNTHGAFVASALLTQNILKKNPDFIVTPIDSSLHNPIEQYGLLLSNKVGATAFYDYLVSNQAQQLIRQHGYGHDL